MSMSHLELFTATHTRRHTGADGKRAGGPRTQTHAMGGEGGKKETHVPRRSMYIPQHCGGAFSRWRLARNKMEGRPRRSDGAEAQHNSDPLRHASRALHSLMPYTTCNSDLLFQHVFHGNKPGLSELNEHAVHRSPNPPSLTFSTRRSSFVFPLLVLSLSLRVYLCN